MSTCDYLYSDSWESDGHVCELEAGHEGPHRVVLEWETRPADICRKEGHTMTEWTPWPPEHESSFLMSGWKTLPTHYRRCSRGCGTREYQGGEKWREDISDILLRGMASPLASLPIRRINTVGEYEP